jgi:hypothetical protein
MCSTTKAMIHLTVHLILTYWWNDQHISPFTFIQSESVVGDRLLLFPMKTDLAAKLRCGPSLCRSDKKTLMPAVTYSCGAFSTSTPEQLLQAAVWRWLYVWCDSGWTICGLSFFRNFHWDSMGQDRSPSLYAAIGQILKGEELPAINVAMLCLKNLLESASSEVALELFGDFTGRPFIDQIFGHFTSACVIENSLSIRCALARRFLLFSESSDLAALTVQTLGDHIVAHLREIDWETNPPELWDLVELLQTCNHDRFQNFCKSLHDSIAKQIHCWSSDPSTRRYSKSTRGTQFTVYSLMRCGRCRDC